MIYSFNLILTVQINLLFTEQNISHTCNNSTESGHIPSDMVDGDVNGTWWQSVTMAMTGSTLNADVRLSFGRLYTLEGGITITFNSGRPEVMVIEKVSNRFKRQMF